MYERNLFVSLVSPSGFGEDLVREEGGGGLLWKIKANFKKIKKYTTYSVLFLFKVTIGLFF